MAQALEVMGTTIHDSSAEEEYRVATPPPVTMTMTMAEATERRKALAHMSGSSSFVPESSEESYTSTPPLQPRLSLEDEEKGESERRAALSMMGVDHDRPTSPEINGADVDFARSRGLSQGGRGFSHTPLPPPTSAYTNTLSRRSAETLKRLEDCSERGEALKMWMRNVDANTRERERERDVNTHSTSRDVDIRSRSRERSQQRPPGLQTSQTPSVSNIRGRFEGKRSFGRSGMFGRSSNYISNSTSHSKAEAEEEREGGCMGRSKSSVRDKSRLRSLSKPGKDKKEEKEKESAGGKFRSWGRTKSSGRGGDKWDRID